ncbi:NUDIX hydrolase [Arthrobacter phage vB_ArtM-ArV1]|uniref:NUDIX hydrolase n=1 Tax=Arthrobacter phage vB_ArtM-ArV1 TaxID=1566993 RepID=A0A0A7HAR9_9CAUD|nr:NUDIX hydrolase [Arthrobacter phage vB_ArtM-ArV1]AIZ01772.1 NUDIX hydrolase [Arthrobacter phage vB_ArtM-ArV1]
MPESFRYRTPLKAVTEAPAAHLIYVLEQTRVEREAQTEKWGEQNWPNGTGPEVVLEAREGNNMDILAYRHKNTTDFNAKQGTLTYKDIFLEEVFEAMAESDPTALRKELIQCAAVALAWVQKIDRDAAR